jgi:hypothetical protein
MTLQFVLGLINLVIMISAGAFNPRTHIEHAFYGLVAVGLSHALPLRKEERPDQARFRLATIFVVVALTLIIFSVTRLRGSWTYG